ncbi:hypothetical protein SAMN05444695_11844 [Rhodococcus triatomae]|uniref:Uncharacterized protein n=1 Tax=Rhodococcus triatomae TaxID=300028 RepID=A0A1G8RMI6_9NOCA|nr:glycosyltransferase [Rhodococcus triatomae]SDJ18191.1 hypothetical protein SAMN05444695_11844 [Rhodococcus triatomae]
MRAAVTGDPRPLKISMVSEQASPLAGWSESGTHRQSVHVAELSGALARAGHDVTVFTRREDDRTPERVDTEAGYTVVHVPVGPSERIPVDDTLQLMGEFGGYLEDSWDVDRPDIVHAHFWMSGIATQLATRILGIPTIQTFHALGVVENRFSQAPKPRANQRVRLEQLIARGATRVVATCTDEVFELSHLGLPRSRTSIVPGGVDLSVFTPEGRRLEKGRAHRLVMAGDLLPSKGIDTAIAALKWLPDTELVIAGGPDPAALDDDQEASRLRTVARRARVQDRVHLLGWVPHEDMPALYRSADAVVCAPWYEPFGTAPLEAMACGTPVVAAAVGSLRETVVDGITGRLVPPRNPKRLADATRQLIEDESARSGFGLAGRDRVRARYSWDRVASETLRAYARCVSAPPKHAKAAAN